MDDKMTVEITGFDAEKHTEDAVKRVTTYSELLIHHASIVSIVRLALMTMPICCLL